MEILSNFSSIYFFIAFIFVAVFMLIAVCVVVIGNIKELRNKIKRYLADPSKDLRCSGCVHIDGPICPYPNYCESMKPTPTCYNCKFSYYGAGPEGCYLHGDIILLSNDTCPDYKSYKDK